MVCPTHDLKLCVPLPHHMHDEFHDLDLAASDAATKAASACDTARACNTAAAKSKSASESCILRWIAVREKQLDLISSEISNNQAHAHKSAEEAKEGVNKVFAPRREKSSARRELYDTTDAAFVCPSLLPSHHARGSSRPPTNRSCVPSPA